MRTSVRTKVEKKQSSISTGGTGKTGALPDMHALEHAMLTLENTCMRVLESELAGGRRDMERMYWQQRFRNIVTPVSLALAEYKGPRRFHYHYRHREEDESILRPVLEPSPIDMLALVCRNALRQCYANLVGFQDERMVSMRQMMENALNGFLLRYMDFTMKKQASDA